MAERRQLRDRGTMGTIVSCAAELPGLIRGYVVVFAFSVPAILYQQCRVRDQSVAEIVRGPPLCCRKQVRQRFTWQGLAISIGDLPGTAC